jgi:hypothetical protein
MVISFKKDLNDYSEEINSNKKYKEKIDEDFSKKTGNFSNK